MSSAYGLCPHEDDPTICPPCNSTKELKLKPAIGNSISAKYDGKCIIMGDDIMVGDQICSYVDFEKEGYAHTECVEY